MAVRYNKLWKLLIDKRIKKVELRNLADIAPNTMTKLGKDEYVSMAVLESICRVLKCDFGDIVEYVEEPKK